MKKKILSLCLVVCLLATAIIGGTLAYFTDTDSATNVMTTGNVKIIQNERQRPLDENGQPKEDATELEDFEQGKPLYPAVFYKEDGTTVIAPDGEIGSADAPLYNLVSIDEVNGETNFSDKLLNKSVTNEVDKIVTVTNKGSRPVYARTIFLMENGILEDGSTLSEYVVKYYTEDGKQNSGFYNKVLDENNELAIFEVNGISYSAHIFYYDYAIQPGKTTHASLKQIYLDPNATNEVSDLIGEEYTIIALSQAVQTDGFNDDRAALNAAFGEVTIEKCKEWFAGYEGIVATPTTKTRPAGYIPAGENVTVKGITIIDNSDDDTNLRALSNVDNDKVKGDLKVLDCILDGTYAMNVYGDNTGDLIVDNTDLRGWVSYSGFISAEFTDCTFGANTNKEIYNNIRPYSDITFTDCEFDGTIFSLDQLPEGAKVTFVNCTMKGTLITSVHQITVDEGNTDVIVIG